MLYHTHLSDLEVKVTDLEIIMLKIFWVKVFKVYIFLNMLMDHVGIYMYWF